MKIRWTIVSNFTIAFPLLYYFINRSEAALVNFKITTDPNKKNIMQSTLKIEDKSRRIQGIIFSYQNFASRE